MLNEVARLVLDALLLAGAPIWYRITKVGGLEDADAFAMASCIEVALLLSPVRAIRLRRPDLHVDRSAPIKPMLNVNSKWRRLMRSGDVRWHLLALGWG